MAGFRFSDRTAASLQAGEALDQFNIVYGHASTGKIMKAQSDNTEAEANAIGIVTQSGGIANNGYGTVVFYGLVTNPLWNLTPLVDVYLGTTYGSINQEAPNTGYVKPIGLAVSATQIFFNFAQPSWEAELDVEAQLPIITNTQANRPDAGIAGREFIPTNGYGPTRQIDNGSSWDHYYGAFKCSLPPKVSTLTSVSVVTGTTFVDRGDHLQLIVPGTGLTAGADSIYVTALPSAPYRFEVGLILDYCYNANYSHLGIVLTNGTSNPALVSFLTGNGNPPFYGSTKYSSPAVWSGDYSMTYPSSLAYGAQIVFLRFRDDNTNRYWEISVDGQVWFTWHSTSRTDYITPTHAGIYGGQSAAGSALAADKTRVSFRIFHWYLG